MKKTRYSVWVITPEINTIYSHCPPEKICFGTCYNLDYAFDMADRAAMMYGYENGDSRIIVLNNETGENLANVYCGGGR